MPWAIQAQAKKHTHKGDRERRRHMDEKKRAHLLNGRKLNAYRADTFCVWQRAYPQRFNLITNISTEWYKTDNGNGKMSKCYFTFFFRSFAQHFDSSFILSTFGEFFSLSLCMRLLFVDIQRWIQNFKRNWMEMSEKYYRMRTFLLYALISFIQNTG